MADIDGNHPSEDEHLPAALRDIEQRIAEQKALLQAIVAQIPVVGGVLVTFYQGRDAELQRQRLEDFVETFGIRLEQLERGQRARPRWAAKRRLL